MWKSIDFIGLAKRMETWYLSYDTLLIKPRGIIVNFIIPTRAIVGWTTW